MWVLSCGCAMRVHGMVWVEGKGRGNTRFEKAWGQRKTEPSFLTRMACSCLISGSRWNITERSFFLQSTTTSLSAPYSKWVIGPYTPYTHSLSLSISIHLNIYIHIIYIFVGLKPTTILPANSVCYLS